MVETLRRGIVLEAGLDVEQVALEGPGQLSASSVSRSGAKTPLLASAAEAAASVGRDVARA